MRNRFGRGWQDLEVFQGRSAEGDRGAKLFEELVLPLLDDLWAFACRLERDPSRAADLLQDALLAGFKKFSQLDSTESFRSWMATIVRRTSHNRHRRKGQPIELSQAIAETAPGCDVHCRRPGPDERLAARRLGGELKDALDDLPEPQRLAVFLIDVQGYSYDEAARVLDAPPGTVASRVARGRASLRVRLHHLARERGWIS